MLLLTNSGMVKAQSSIYDFQLLSVNGYTINLNAYQGKKILIVNTASLSEHASQLQELEQLYQQYKDSGLVVIAIPSNDFTNEAKSNTEINASYGVSFPVAVKTSVTGSSISPLYVWLTKKERNNVSNSEVKTDFQKYLIGGDGKLVGTFSSAIKPKSRFIKANL